MDYQSKYNKYKAKYMALKAQLGGNKTSHAPAVPMRNNSSKSRAVMHQDDQPALPPLPAPTIPVPNLPPVQLPIVRHGGYNKKK